jgi:hypothetical protein
MVLFMHQRPLNAQGDKHILAVLPDRKKETVKPFLVAIPVAQKVASSPDGAIAKSGNSHECDSLSRIPQSSMRATRYSLNHIGFNNTKQSCKVGIPKQSFGTKQLFYSDPNYCQLLTPIINLKN